MSNTGNSKPATNGKENEKGQKREDEIKKIEKNIKWYTRCAWGFVVFGLVFALLPLVTSKIMDMELNNYGDYTGGVVASLWSLAGLFMVYIAFLGQRIDLLNQQTEISLTREEMQAQRAAMQEQAQEAKEQAEALKQQTILMQGQQEAMREQQLITQFYAQLEFFRKIQAQKTFRRMTDELIDTKSFAIEFFIEWECWLECMSCPEPSASKIFTQISSPHGEKNNENALLEYLGGFVAVLLVVDEFQFEKLQKKYAEILLLNCSIYEIALMSACGVHQLPTSTFLRLDESNNFKQVKLVKIIDEFVKSYWDTCYKENKNIYFVKINEYCEKYDLDQPSA